MGWLLYHTLAIDPDIPTTVYAGSDHGVSKSTNGGENWTDTGLGGSEFYTLAIDPNTPATIYAASYVQGVFKSTDWAAKTGQPSMQD